MKHHQLVQGTPEWHAHRNDYKNASDTPIILGLVKSKSRTEFMNEKKSGLTKEVGYFLQKIFDDGHEFEALARPLAEKIIGKDLYPVTGSDGEYSASFDGLTMNEDIAFEHKTLNDELREIFADIETRAPDYREDSGDLLPKKHRAQMEVQLMVSGAEKCLFMASKWDVNGVLVEEKHTWYLANPELRKEIIAAWEQFDIDMETHEVVEVIEKPQGEAVLQLPALFIQATGAIIASNLKEFGLALNDRLDKARSLVYVTDQDFANAKTLAKNIRDGIKQINAAKVAMLEQTATVGETSRMIDEWAENMRITALKLETDVTAQDKLKRNNMINAAQIEFREVADALETRTAPIRLNLQMPDFAGAIKGKSKYSNMEDAINTLLANSTSEATRACINVIDKQKYIKDWAGGYEYLFSDLQQIIFRFAEMDDFKFMVDTRVKSHKDAEAVKAEQIKKQAEIDAANKLAKQQEEKAAAELLEKQAAETVQPEQSPQLSLAEVIDAAPVASTRSWRKSEESAPEPEQVNVTEPTIEQIVRVVAAYAGVDMVTSHAWLAGKDWFEYTPE